MSTYASRAPLTIRADEKRTPYGRWAVASVGLMAIATANGVTREILYADYLGDVVSHRVSLLPMAALFGAYVWWLQRRLPLPSLRSAFAVGVVWAAIAVGFELGVGHYVDDRSWSELLREYDLTKGRNGALVLLCTVATPVVVRLVRRRLRRR